MTTLNCKSCGGKGTTFSAGFTALDGVVYPDRTSSCASCRGIGTFPSFDEATIRSAILATKGKNQGKIRAAMTSTFKDPVAARAYYVWRLARFHGGADVTMPVMADLAVRGDPCKDELDKLADAVAREQFGSDLGAALRWGRAFGAF